ncbi:MAG: hypothetical protein BWZ03_00514 [bacterium ADurb.BinA186]|nr:MAG: hypothetical protein BWZ03_00514 [bacterium ADurb.BinA186]
MNDLKHAMDACLKDLNDVDFSQDRVRAQKAKSPISLWLPQEYKDKYDDLQAITGGKYSKFLQQAVKKLIDSAIKR